LGDTLKIVSVQGHLQRFKQWKEPFGRQRGFIVGQFKKELFGLVGFVDPFALLFEFGVVVVGITFFGKGIQG